MVSINTFRKLALTFDETTEEPHFEKPSFRIKNKIFATIDLKKETATIKLSEIDQSVFCSLDKSVIYPVSGTWGKQGWTIINLTKVKSEILEDILTVSYCTVAPKRLAKRYKHNDEETTNA